MAKNKRKYIYLSILILFMGWLVYTTNTLKEYSDNLSKVIEHINVTSTDTLNTDTTKINIINTQENEK